jgi:hypothetical protein
VLLGNGDGSFQSPKTYAAGNHPNAAAVGDVNGDGNLDFIVANFGDYYSGAGGSLSVLLNNGDGTFQAPQDYATGAGARAVLVGEFNDDSIPDVVVANSNSGTVRVLLGKGDGTFQLAQNYATGNSPDALAMGDFNGDGIPDLAVANYGSGTVSLLLGKGDGTFPTTSDVSVGITPSAVLVSPGGSLIVANFYWSEVSVVVDAGGPDGASGIPPSDPRTMPTDTRAPAGSTRASAHASPAAREATAFPATPMDRPAAPPVPLPRLPGGYLEDAVFAGLGLNWDMP